MWSENGSNGERRHGKQGGMRKWEMGWKKTVTKEGDYLAGKKGGHWYT